MHHRILSCPSGILHISRMHMAVHACDKSAADAVAVLKHDSHEQVRTQRSTVLHSTLTIYRSADVVCMARHQNCTRQQFLTATHNARRAAALGEAARESCKSGRQLVSIRLIVAGARSRGAVEPMLLILRTQEGTQTHAWPITYSYFLCNGEGRAQSHN